MYKLRCRIVIVFCCQLLAIIVTCNSIAYAESQKVLKADIVYVKRHEALSDGWWGDVWLDVISSEPGNRGLRACPHGSFLNVDSVKNSIGRDLHIDPGLLNRDEVMRAVRNFSAKMSDSNDSNITIEGSFGCFDPSLDPDSTINLQILNGSLTPVTSFDRERLEKSEIGLKLVKKDEFPENSKWHFVNPSYSPPYELFLEYSSTKVYDILAYDKDGVRADDGSLSGNGGCFATSPPNCRRPGHLHLKLDREPRSLRVELITEKTLPREHYLLGPIDVSKSFRHPCFCPFKDGCDDGLMYEIWCAFQ